MISKGRGRPAPARGASAASTRCRRGGVELAGQRQVEAELLEDVRIAPAAEDARPARASGRTAGGGRSRPRSAAARKASRSRTIGVAERRERRVVRRGVSARNGPRRWRCSRAPGPRACAAATLATRGLQVPRPMRPSASRNGGFSVRGSRSGAASAVISSAPSTSTARTARAPVATSQPSQPGPEVREGPRRRRVVDGVAAERGHRAFLLLRRDLASGDDILMTDTLVLANATLVLPDEMLRGSLPVRDGMIAAIATAPPCRRARWTATATSSAPAWWSCTPTTSNATSRPRPKVDWPHHAAIVAHDAELASTGITTVFDALRVGSIVSGAAVHYGEYARALADEILAMRRRGRCGSATSCTCGPRSARRRWWRSWTSSAPRTGSASSASWTTRRGSGSSRDLDEVRRLCDRQARDDRGGVRRAMWRIWKALSDASWRGARGGGGGRRAALWRGDREP